MAHSTLVSPTLDKLAENRYNQEQTDGSISLTELLVNNRLSPYLAAAAAGIITGVSVTH